MPDSTRHEIIFAVMRRIVGDLPVTATALALAKLGRQNSEFGRFSGTGMTPTAILLGLGCTAFSEWLNAQIRQSCQCRSAAHR